MSTHLIKKTEYTSNVWFKIENTINESCFDRLFAMFDECEFTNVPDLTVKEFVSKLQEWECNNSNRKHKPSCINYGATIEVMLPEKLSIEVMQLICDRFIKDNFEGYPYFATYYHRGSAVCLFFWIFTRQYYENKRVERIYYTNDIYSNSKTGRICKKDDVNAVLIHKKNDIKKELLTEFSLIKARFFSFTKKKFKEFREMITENIIAIFVDILSTKVVHEVSLPKFSITSVRNRSELMNVINVLNPKVKEIEGEINEIYQAMLNCDMLQELKKDFKIEIIQRIRNILRMKAFHHGNMRKPLKIEVEMNRNMLESNLEILLELVQALKVSFFKKYFSIEI
ncbi:MAG: hypothetical protein E7192_00505 [Erysipelotrichaceae bacterium]|nr:hypothetical protein [Erysipelotrichaceae bacterium]